MIPTCVPEVYKYYLLWAVGIPRVRNVGGLGRQRVLLSSQGWANEFCTGLWDLGFGTSRSVNRNVVGLSLKLTRLKGFQGSRSKRFQASCVD